ncbi:hypothetical protein HYE67_004351 [Fusarium culmorum]|uniref:Uncharacterized protein n=1 Tax=Fusarium culmorum TaxID=5516 RepID=A0A7S8D548_FUSCU|nr:hypothetical protein HYE67_004351 [Fusarium culmorum]
MYPTFNQVFSNHGSLTSVSETREEVQANLPAKTEEGVVSNMRPSSAPGFFPEFVEDLLISKHGHSVYRVCTSITDHGLPVQTSKAELARQTGTPAWVSVLVLYPRIHLHDALKGDWGSDSESQPGPFFTACHENY